jgi:hypothetical protein
MIWPLNPVGLVCPPSKRVYSFFMEKNIPAPIDNKEWSAASALQRLLRIPFTPQQSPIETEGIHG